MRRTNTRIMLAATATMLTVALGVGSWYLIDTNGDQNVSTASPAEAPGASPSAESSTSSTSAAPVGAASGATGDEPAPESEPLIGACGNELPLEVTFGSPDEIDSDETTVTGDGAFVRRLVHSSGAALEVTWPASRTLYDLEAAPSMTEHWPLARPEPERLWVGVAQGNNGDVSVVPDIMVELIEGWEPEVPDLGACETVAIAAFEGEQLLASVQWHLDPTLAPEWGAAVEESGSMVTSTEEVTEPPAGAIPCSGNGSVEEGAPSEPVEPAPTPAEALAAFFDDGISFRVDQHGLHEMKVSDDHYVYGVPLSRAAAPITSASEFVALFSVERASGGWSVTGWQKSGC